MSKCLVTKLLASVDNANLRKFGELRFKCLEDTQTDLSNFVVTSNRTITIVGNTGTIYDGAEWIANSNNNRIHATAGSIVSMPDKYSLIEYVTKGTNVVQTENNDLSDLMYCTNLESIYQAGDRNNFNGDISSLKLLTKLKEFHQFSKTITGLYETIGAKQELVELSLGGSRCGGNLHTLFMLCPNISYMTCGSGHTYGDVSNSPCYQTFILGDDNNCSWSTGGRVAAGFNFITYLKNVNLGTDLDNMLIEQASLSVHPKATRFVIDVKGTHTMSENTYNAAINTLKDKGYTVTINGVTQ